MNQYSGGNSGMTKHQVYLSSLNSVEYLDQTMVTAHLKNALTQSKFGNCHHRSC